MSRYLLIAPVIAMGIVLTAVAKVESDKAEALGQSLTPVGAQKAGNDAGTIPEWTGGLALDDLDRDDDPYSDDDRLYTITADNYQDYGDVLSEGHKHLFKTFPKTYKMHVYPTRRSASYPDWFYDATKANASRVELTNGGNGFCCAAKGYPFPIPTNGTEVMWNHQMRYNTRGWRGYVNHSAVNSNGAHVVERNYLELVFAYNNPETTVGELDNQNVFVMVKTVSPPNKAGEAHLLHVPLDRVKDSTNVWVYSPSQRRVRRIDDVGYDNPAFDGLMTHDQIDMFNGPTDRYNLKLIGKREMLVPYNSYELYSDDHEYEDIIQPGHINQDLVRYELHRVWVLEATVRDGVKHRYKKRRFYLDEDSWLILLQDIYDERDAFWRTAEAHPVNFADVPVVVSGVQVHYDLQSRRYVILNMTNEEDERIEWGWDKDARYFSPSTLKRFAR